MNPLFSVLGLLILITPHISFAMDFNKETDIPLEAIYSKATIKLTTTKSAEEQFAAFEQKISDEFGDINDWYRKKKLSANVYFKRAQTEAPQIIADAETIEKFSQNNDSYFAKAIKGVRSFILDEYNKVTSDTLAIIDNPNAPQPSAIVNQLPPAVKTYVMSIAYDAIDAEQYACLQFPPNTKYVSASSAVDLAVTMNKIEGTFHVWDLKTGNSSALPKKMGKNEISESGIGFSDNGLQIMTITIHQKEPQIIQQINIWDSVTKNLMNTIEHPCLVEKCLLQNKSEEQTLWIYDTSNNLLAYTIKKDGSSFPSQQINAEIKKINCATTQKQIYTYSKSESTLYKKCIAYFLCLKAIQNTKNKKSLDNVRTALIYQSLTSLEKSLIEQEINQKTAELTQAGSQQGENILSTLRVWLG